MDSRWSLASRGSILSIASGGRFELAIGAGDYPQEYTAWHLPFPDALTRIAALADTIAALRLVWKGELVTYAGEHVQLTDAACTPAPPVPPRVVVGVGGSRRLLRSAVTYADELNLYGVDEVPPEAIEQAGVILRTVGKLADAIRCLDGLKDVSQTLEDEGVAAVVKSYDELLQSLHDKANTLK